MTLRTIRGPEDFAAAFGVSRDTIGRLLTFESLLRRWQKAVNLVAPGTLEAVWHRHFADSAQLASLAAPGARSFIDLGSGAGFPGLVVAIMLADSPPPLRPRGEGRGRDQAQPASGAPSPLHAPGGPPARLEEAAVRFVLIESDTRKAAFLREVVRGVGALPAIAVDILSARAESARTRVNLALPPRVICARALAPLDRLLALASPLSPPGTTGLFCKGKEVAKELQAAAKNWKFDVALLPSVTDRNGRIAVITNLERKAKD